MEDYINEIQQIGLCYEPFWKTRKNVFFYSDHQLKSSEKILFKEIQCLKEDLNKNYTKLNYTNELQTIDERTLKIFQTKVQDFKQILSNIKQKETNICNLVQVRIEINMVKNKLII